MYVLHKCDNRKCVNPIHLFLGTHKENMEDMKRKGRASGPRQPGEQNSQAKLTNVTAEKLKTALVSGMSQRAAAKEFGVSQKTAWNIAHGKTYAGI